VETVKALTVTAKNKKIIFAKDIEILFKIAYTISMGCLEITPYI
jgi:hypothetical protein